MQSSKVKSISIWPCTMSYYVFFFYLYHWYVSQLYKRSCMYKYFSIYKCFYFGLVWFGLISLFNGISTLCRLFNAIAILLEEQVWYYLTHSWEDRGVHTFPKSICLKVNVIARLEYELTYYNSIVHHFNHYTTRISPLFTLFFLPLFSVFV